LVPSVMTTPFADMALKLTLIESLLQKIQETVDDVKSSMGVESTPEGRPAARRSTRHIVVSDTESDFDMVSDNLKLGDQTLMSTSNEEADPSVESSDDEGLSQSSMSLSVERMIHFDSSGTDILNTRLRSKPVEAKNKEALDALKRTIYFIVKEQTAWLR
jgi:uncharacterized protein (UPF0264 family)